VRKFLVFAGFLVGNLAILFTALIFLVFYFPSHSPKKALAEDLQAVYSPNASYEKYLAFDVSSVPTGEISQTIIARDSRPKIVDDFFHHHASPMEGLGQTIVETADKYQIPFGYLPAIGFCEGQAGKVIPPESFNTWGWNIWGTNVHKFTSWENAIETVTKGLRKYYFDQGYNTPDTIMTKYTPSSNGSWANCVSQFLNELR